MKKFKFYFTKKDGHLALCSVHTKTGVRSYNSSCLKENGVDPEDFRWDDVNRMFEMSGGFNVKAMRANMKLADIIEHYEKESMNVPRKETNPFTYRERIAKRKAKERLEKEMNAPSLGDFLRSIIKDMRNGKSGLPAKSWQNYSNLLNKLCKEGEIVEMSVAVIDNDVAERFAEWVAEELDGKNYNELNKMLRATITKAFEAGYCRRKLTYNYGNSVYAPNRVKSAFLDVLSHEQWESFKSFNLTNLHFDNQNYERMKWVYRDFCVLMYETDLRPCDLCRASRAGIRQFLGNYFYCYVPLKKRYMKVAREVATPLSEEALKIIYKYDCEMLLPLTFNEKYTNLNDNAEYKKFDSGRNNLLRNINGWLHELSKHLGFNISSLYMLRHTSITHKVNQKGANLMQIAKNAGTSVRMIEQTYYSPLAL